MKKTIVVLVILIMSCSWLSGCSILKEKEPISITNRFVIVSSEKGDPFDEWRKAYTCADKETGVVYFIIVGDRKMAMTPLLNADGVPMIYDFKQHQIIKKEGNTK